jgi:hypothetical protein
MKSYHELIAKLSERLHMEIYPDLNNVVTLKLEKRVKIQLESDSLDEVFLLGAYITFLPPGKFREHILKGALKANFSINKKPEILSYMTRENTLTLHRKFLLSSLTIDDLIKHIKAIVERAKKWMDAIESGRAFPDDEIEQGTDKSSKAMFGL